MRQFLLGGERYLFLNGTHQYEKHLLVLREVFAVYPGPAAVLFRANSSDTLETISDVLEAKARRGEAPPHQRNSPALHGHDEPCVVEQVAEAD
ncbi:MAG: hypothetical protein IAG13_02635 [Deltaproteobacteria bacterium]|nr:hypothetical protein [Nannocystaceae bacterium]